MSSRLSKTSASLPTCTCHGASGQGGVGPRLAGGEVLKTFPNIDDHIAWVTNGSAGVKGKDIATALKAIEAKGVPFVTRSDRSGTHAAELALWIVAGIDIASAKGAWYREIDQGMGGALDAARKMNAYMLVDRGAWISFKDRGDLDIVVEGDKRLFNQYGVMLVNPDRHPNVKKELGQQFVDWVISPEGQKAIASYKINGKQLFYPNAQDPAA